ncbi:hypothetical protein Ssed_2894 [Shewanella sediminis HAW-EB3]|uniref:Uncharacterized protein n=1 Tax=Shewanella sediminis (strain HAW-EB3) TaxID=425104 RepID=A8FXC8_SHESH|nr:hypothetical protein [Shewanella sediminis]ABV37501.1 hypothetical protein Ssed_2894 [Shewanella sediminis HAW-EB3]
MMWNWLSKFFGKQERSQRKRVRIDIPYEQHSYRKEDFDIDENSVTMEEDNIGN